VVEQPIRNRQVAGSSPALGSSVLGSGPETWATESTAYMRNSHVSGMICHLSVWSAHLTSLFVNN
jgi:hypothetical protein